MPPVCRNFRLDEARAVTNMTKPGLRIAGKSSDGGFIDCGGVQGAALHIARLDVKQASARVEFEDDCRELVGKPSIGPLLLDDELFAANCGGFQSPLCSTRAKSSNAALAR